MTGDLCIFEENPEVRFLSALRSARALFPVMAAEKADEVFGVGKFGDQRQRSANFIPLREIVDEAKDGKIFEGKAD